MDDSVARVAQELLGLGTATLGESGAYQMHPRMKPAWRGASVAAPAFTVQCAAGDNLAVHVAVAAADAGRVLAVDVSEMRELGYWGEVLTAAAQARGIAGLVIDGGVRDVVALERRAFPVFATVVALPGATKLHGGSVGGLVRVGDVDVDDGDWVVGDADGVIVIPLTELDAVVAAGRARAAKEKNMFARLQAGATTLELLDLDTTPVVRRYREPG